MPIYANICIRQKNFKWADLGQFLFLGQVLPPNFVQNTKIYREKTNSFSWILLDLKLQGRKGLKTGCHFGICWHILEYIFLVFFEHFCLDDPKNHQCSFRVQLFLGALSSSRERFPSRNKRQVSPFFQNMDSATQNLRPTWPFCGIRASVRKT